MPIITLNLSSELWEKWQFILETFPSKRLKKIGLLGDWVITGFIVNINNFLRESFLNLFDEIFYRHIHFRYYLGKMKRRIVAMFNVNERISLIEISQVLGVTIDESIILVDLWIAENFLISKLILNERTDYLSNLYILFNKL